MGENKEEEEKKPNLKKYCGSNVFNIEKIFSNRFIEFQHLIRRI